MASSSVHTATSTAASEPPVQTSSSYGKTSVLAWIVTLECVAVIFSAAIMLLTAPSAPIATAAWLSVSFTKLNWISNVTAIFDMLACCTTFYINDKYGIKISIILATVITTVGCWVRWTAVLVPVQHRYTVFIIGQAFGRIGCPIITNVVTKLVAAWFAPQHRTIATSILTLHLGGAIAPLVLPVIAQSAKDVPLLLLVTACICTACSIPAFFLPSKPRTPPSVSAETDRVSSWEGVKQMAKNTTFWWIVMASSVQFGISMAFSTVMLEVIIPYGYTQQQAGICQAVLIISGCFGGVVAGHWLGKSGQFLKAIKVFAICSILSCALLAVNILPNAFPTVLTTCLVHGFFSFGGGPIFLELASEVTYPVSESISTSIVWLVSAINMLVFTIIFDALRAREDANPPHHMTNSMIAATGILAAGSIPWLWIKEDLKRLQVDRHDEKAIIQQNE